MSKYVEGYPKERGLFRCIIDGEREQILVHHYCGTTRRHWWTDTAGYDAIGNIQYDPDAVAVRKKK